MNILHVRSEVFNEFWEVKKSDAIKIKQLYLRSIYVRTGTFTLIKALIIFLI